MPQRTIIGSRSHIGCQPGSGHTQLGQHGEQQCLQLLTCLAPTIGEPVGSLLQLRKDGVHLFHHLADAVVQTVGSTNFFIQPTLGIQKVGNGADTMLFLQTVYQVESLGNDGLTLRRELQSVVERGSIRKQVLQFDDG